MLKSEVESVEGEVEILASSRSESTIAASYSSPANAHNESQDDRNDIANSGNHDDYDAHYTESDDEGKRTDKDNDINDDDLVDKCSSNNSSSNDNSFASNNHRCRLDRILEEIDELRKEDKNYSIYVTGHSLGGALGLLTALEAGARFGKNGLPVTYVGIANPRGGTEAFRDGKCFYLLLSYC